jgi:hypothetical protein
MTQREILEEIKRLTPTERLALIEAALRLVREDLPPVPFTMPKRKQLALAAEALRSDYLNDPDLTAFTALDGEPFHA